MRRLLAGILLGLFVIGCQGGKSDQNSGRKSPPEKTDRPTDGGSGYRR
ncbi:MAG: hypothetical protein KatS3mg105_2287 [Gemmatales bacterium]|nr:MAG: hypothetical protein KatS3mg105_2287 [Gemmatales bacterium]